MLPAAGRQLTERSLQQLWDMWTQQNRVCAPGAATYVYWGRSPTTAVPLAPLSTPYLGTEKCIGGAGQQQQCLRHPCQPRTLAPLQTRASKRKTLVLDLDETLVHSSLDGTGQPHFTFPVGRVSLDVSPVITQKLSLSSALSRFRKVAGRLPLARWRCASAACAALPCPVFAQSSPPPPPPPLHAAQSACSP